jgi:DDE family transposase
MSSPMASPGPRHTVFSGDLLAFCLTPGNLDDRRPVPRLVWRLFGKLYEDRGYLSQPLAEQLLSTCGLHVIPKVRKNMHGRLLAYGHKLLRKRAIIESINDQLKNVCPIEHTRHRSPFNFLVHLLAGLIAYGHQSNKPSLQLDLHQLTRPLA